MLADMADMDGAMECNEKQQHVQQQHGQQHHCTVQVSRHHTSDKQ